MHFNEIIHHKLLVYEGIYSNQMVHEAHQEWKHTNEKAAAKKAAYAKLTGGLKDAFKK